MPSYRILRMKEAERQRFRWAPHTSGATLVKLKDFEEAGSVEAPGVYAAWALLRDAARPLEAGDILEHPDEGPRIYKYVGFEEARWMLPETHAAVESSPPAPGAPQRP
jgi:hypothetical protein